MNRYTDQYMDQYMMSPDYKAKRQYASHMCFPFTCINALQHRSCCTWSNCVRGQNLPSGILAWATPKPPNSQRRCQKKVKTASQIL